MCTNHSDVINRFLSGIRGFKERFYENDPEFMRDLAEHGQHPEVLLIACSDSRVDPTLLTGARPGELFVVRNVANLVPPYLLDGEQDGARAAIEYAVRDLGVSNIVVLGHAQCGGIKALLKTITGEQLADRDFIGGWVSMAHSACQKYIIQPLHSSESHAFSGNQIDDFESVLAHPHLAERAMIQGSLANLETYPWIKERIEAGKLRLHGWWFDLETGDLWSTNEDDRVLMPVLD